MYYNEIKLSGWREAREVFSQLQESGQRWIYRGHYKAEWKLQPSLERIVSQSPVALQTENTILQAFKRRAHQYLPLNQIPETILEWMALMQHHGAPTRLLDWTKSPFIAAFIAFENAYKEEGDAAIWAIDADWLSKATMQKLEANNINIDVNKIYTDKELIRFIYLDTNLVLPAEPELMNERLTIQQGVFLIASGKKLEFEQSLLNYCEFDPSDFIKKYTLPKTEGIACLTDLQRMNINAASLFPGLDGFARSLRTIPDITYYNIYKEENLFEVK